MCVRQGLLCKCPEAMSSQALFKSIVAPSKSVSTIPVERTDSRPGRCERSKVTDTANLKRRLSAH